MIGKKYTAEYKIGKVNEYLARIENGEKLSKADFAYENGISDSTFNDWVIKFQRMGKGCMLNFHSPLPFQNSLVC